MLIKNKKKSLLKTVLSFTIVLPLILVALQLYNASSLSVILKIVKELFSLIIKCPLSSSDFNSSWFLNQITVGFGLPETFVLNLT